MKTKALIPGILALASVATIASAQAGKGATKVESVTGIVVSPPAGGAGPTVKWNAIDKATFQVERSKAGDSCCNYSSQAGMTATSWQDAPLPSSGIYIYRVIATLRTGQVVGATQFSYTAPAAPPAPAPPAAPPPPAATGRYRVTLRSIQVVTPTADDPTQKDGVGDEVYAAAVIVRADRATATKLGASVVKSKEYGDIGSNGVPFPNRIRAGTASAEGGLNGGSSIGMPGTPGAETFPIVLWEGSLTDGGEAFVVVPSIWERDTLDISWTEYSQNWMNSPAPILGSQLLVDQYTNTVLAPVVAKLETGAVQQGVTGPVYGNYVIGLDRLSGADRMIGLATATGTNPTYSERIIVLTREKLAGLVVGGMSDLQIQLNENDTQHAGYTMILRVERIG
jgi:hypothetical protein